MVSFFSERGIGGRGIGGAVRLFSLSEGAGLAVVSICSFFMRAERESMVISLITISL